MITGGNEMERLKKTGKSLEAALKEIRTPAKRRAELTSGMAIRIAREGLSLTQGQLAEKTGLKQSTISALENDRETLGVDRAMVLARALKVHPSVLAFPGWEIEAKDVA